MFLYQKLGYYAKFINNEQDLEQVIAKFNSDKSKIALFDTETTGLNFIHDVPFLMTFGWGKNVFGLNLLTHSHFVPQIYEMFKQVNWLFAHNAKYDYHMMGNLGYPIPSSIHIADSQTVARLTAYADDKEFHKSLEYLGTKYVDENAKFASKVIKAQLTKINAERKSVTKAVIISEFRDINFSDVWEQYENRVQYLDSPYDHIFTRIDELYKEANYLDVFTLNPNLMISYAFDDIVIMSEYLGKSIPVLKTTDPGLRTFKRECDLIPVVAEHERIGFKVDVKYVLESRVRVCAYRERLYHELRELTGIPTLTVGQHAVIKILFEQKFNIPLEKVDAKSLLKIDKEGVPLRVARLIKKLRTLDKWLSTYIDGFLNKLNDGRIYTSVDLAGTVSGRVSSSFQQQPKFPLLDETEAEIFHPRKAVIPDDDYYLFFFDYSQQELRVQAYYTLLSSVGDLKLCRAFMPFKCTSMITGEEFDTKNQEHIKRWNSGEWLDEDDKLWVKVDVHTETTLTAFPHISESDEHFDEYRKKGKMCNFLKNYQGGIDAIMEQLDVSEEIAKVLDRAYYDTFPLIREYQKWVTRELTRVGYVENLYGRRYYMENSKFFYKASNYLVQGSSADMVKSVELKVHDLLKGTKSSFIMPVHDEIIVRIHKDDISMINQIRGIMEDIPEVPEVPMVSDVEYTQTNWGDKKKWKGVII